MESIYKVIFKVFSIRFKKMLDKIGSFSQKVFVEGGQIFDATLVANEVVDFRRKLGVCANLILKRPV